jgi:regulator of ribonuclease activity A
LSDTHPDAAIADALFRDFGGATHFFGPIATVKVFEDNSLVRSMLEQPGKGRVLVVDGGGSMRCALVGGQLAGLGVANGWSGVVINGCIRDSMEIRATALGVKALGVHPRRSTKGAHGGQCDIPLRFAGVEFRPTHWLYADMDGIVLAGIALHATP